MTSPTGKLRLAAPLLTIAIPTYNRASFLRELLDSLEPQLCYEPRVELIISDNCSQDQTAAVVAEFANRGLSLRIIRNTTNIGPDPNFLQCFEQARGEYFWLIGDDDIVAPGAIEIILGYLESGKYDMLYMSQFPVREAEIKPPHITNCRSVICTDARDYARRIDVFFTFISANIIRKKAALEQPPAEFTKLIGTNLVQLSWTYSALNATRCSLWLKTPMLGARVDNTGGYQLFEVFGPKLKSITCAWVRDKNVAKQIENGVLRKFLPGFSYKSKRTASPFSDKGSATSVLTPTFRGNPRYWLFVYPILVLPKLPAAGWYVIVKIVNRLLRTLNIG